MYERGIEAFLAVAMSRTLGKAAKLLNVTQSTVSYNLSELENELGMILVDRQKGVKSIQLTPAGEGLLPLALRWQETIREISGLRTPGVAYKLTIGGSESVNYRILKNIYRKLICHEPPVFMKIITDLSDMMYPAIESRAIDIAITLHEESSRFVQIEPFYSESFVAARIAEEGEEAGEYVDIGTLLPECEFYIEWSGSYRLWHDHIWDPSQCAHVKLDSMNLATMLMTRPGQWCMIPESGVEQFRRESPHAVFQKLHDGPPDITYYELTHRYPKASSLPGIKIFDKILRECFPTKASAAANKKARTQSAPM